MSMPSPPLTPTALAGELIGPPHQHGIAENSDPYSVSLTWADANDGAAQTKVYRSDAWAEPFVLATIPAGASAYTDAGPLVPNRVYVYTLSAVVGTAESVRTSPDDHLQVHIPIPVDGNGP
jgi:hypothetical protein